MPFTKIMKQRRNILSKSWRLTSQWKPIRLNRIGKKGRQRNGAHPQLATSHPLGVWGPLHWGGLSVSQGSPHGHSAAPTGPEMPAGRTPEERSRNGCGSGWPTKKPRDCLVFWIPTNIWSLLLRHPRRPRTVPGFQGRVFQFWSLKSAQVSNSQPVRESFN